MSPPPHPPPQDISSFPALKTDSDLELVHTLGRETQRSSACCNINAVGFSLDNPLFLLHLIRLTGGGCLLTAVIDRSPKMLRLETRSLTAATDADMDLHLRRLSAGFHKVFTSVWLNVPSKFLEMQMCHRARSSGGHLWMLLSSF